MYVTNQKGLVRSSKYLLVSSAKQGFSSDRRSVLSQVMKDGSEGGGRYDGS